MPYGKISSLRNKAGEDTSLVASYRGSKQVFLIDDLAKKKATAALVFSGQGFTYFAEIISLYQHSFAARRWINAAFEEMHKWLDDDFIVTQSPNILTDSAGDPSLSGCPLGPVRVTEDVLHPPILDDQDVGKPLWVFLSHERVVH